MEGYVPVVDGDDKPTRTHLTRAVKLTERFGGYLPAWQLAVFLHADAGQRDEAIAMARGTMGRSAQITMLHHPPILMTDVL